MNSKNSLLKLVFASLTCLVVMAACLTGCGGSNPSGPTTAAAVTTGTPSATSAIPSLSSGTVQLIGSIIDASTGNLVNNPGAKIVVTAKLITQTGAVITPTTVNAFEFQNQAFAFNNLYKGGYYLISTVDSGGIYEPKSEILELNANTQIRLSLTPVAGSKASASLNFFCTVKDALNQAPVMAATIKVSSNASQTFQTTTIENGTFGLMMLASGTYEITFTKDGFKEEKRTLNIDNTNIWLDQITISATGTYTDGSNVAHPGFYNLGVITLAPLWTNTGSLQGILYTDVGGVKTPLVSSSLKLWYDSAPNDQYAPSIIYDWLTTNTLGYFSMKSLPTGYYMITDSPAAPVAILNPDGDIIGYDLTGEITKIWMQVLPGAVTLIPVQEK